MEQQETPEEVKPARNLIKHLREFLGSLVKIGENIDYPQTLKKISDDVEFKGYNIWILIASIFIASIGLNANSAAVIIGAMLISPLMGPIVGVGMAMATNDWSLLIKALKNTAVFVLVSIITSSIYFKLTPLGDAASELIGRTKPNFLDVLVAFFGGIAGIVAVSRKETSNVVPGVAIATALMPPLCTAGYGFAHGNWNYFLGAGYLFLINTVFIAIATFIVARYLQFPRFNFVDPKREKKVKIYFVFFLLVFLVPSVRTLIGTYQESKFATNLQQFVNREVKPVYRFPMVESNKDSLQIVISTSGFIDDKRRKEFQSKLANYNLQSYSLKLMSDIDYEQFNKERNQELDKVTTQLDRQFGTIQRLQAEIDSLKADTIAFYGINRKAQALFPELKSMGITKGLLYSDFNQNDTLTTVILDWENGPGDTERLSRWLEIELDVDSIKIIEE